MEHRTFLRALTAAEGPRDFLLATLLNGPACGETLLLRGGKPVWGEASLWQNALPALQTCTATGVLELDGLRIFAEWFGSGVQLVICGGGHVATAAVQIAKLLGLPVTGLEDRPEYADALRKAGADSVICAPFADALKQISGSAETYFIVVTRAHAFDIVCLKEILKKPAAYVGMMGSRGRADLVRRQLLKAGVDQTRVEQLHAPIGLAIGAKTAQEIALSILAQVVEVKSSRQLTEGFSVEMMDALERVERDNVPAVLVTIVSRHGSTPREVGSKMLIWPDGKAVGSVGGGIMEHRICQLAEKMLVGDSAPAQLAAFSADGQNEDAALAACGGSMEVFLQRMNTFKGESNDEAR